MKCPIICQLIKSAFSQMIGHFFKLNLKRHNFLLKNKNFINI